MPGSARSRVVVVPPRPARVVAVPARPARVVAIPASGSPMVPVPVSGSSAPVVAAVPIPVIAPPRVPEFSWAPSREGPGLCLRFGCDAHSGEAQGDSYGEYGCNKMCKRSNSFHVCLVPPEPGLETSGGGPVFVAASRQIRLIRR